MSDVLEKLDKIAVAYNGTLTPALKRAFQAAVLEFYKNNGREFSWRAHITPYRVVVSEIMLQQTQTDRVAKKFTEFLELFPSFVSLARASRADVLKTWQGLGYNRRALFLHELAQTVIKKYKGRLPEARKELISLPGIGVNTAGSVIAFAFNQPTVFIETNIRSVFLHTFFQGQAKITDAQVLPLIELTLDRKNPRQWYWALMDLGVFLKKTLPNPSRQSAHHTKQARFIGSNRQLRGAVIRLLTEQPILTVPVLLGTLTRAYNVPPRDITKALDTLLKDGFVSLKNGLVELKK